MARLVTLLDPDVTWRSDGGGVVTAAREPLAGAHRVAHFFMNALAKNSNAIVREQETPDGLGFVMWAEGRVIGVVTLEVVDGLIAEICTVMNPYRLTLWN